MTKKVLNSLFLLLISGILCSGAVAQDKQIDIKHSELYINESQSLIPLRRAAEECGYTVLWDGFEASIEVKNDLHSVKIFTDRNTFAENDDKATHKAADLPVFVDGRESQIKCGAVIRGERTYVEPEFIMNIFSDRYITKSEDGGFVLCEKPEISGENMIAAVHEISEIPRGVKDETHADAMNYVISKFKEYGYETEKQEFDFNYMNWAENKAETANGTNLVAVLKPDLSETGDIFIIGAHYDGYDGAPAANDNGSGLSVLLELAKVLKNVPSDTEIRFVAFDAEETGLNGSKAYVKTLSKDNGRVIGMLNFDMLGGAKAKNFGVHTTSGKENFLFEILKQNVDFESIALKEHPGGMSDHMSFEPMLIPNLDFSHEAINGEYHSQNDIADYISPNMLKYSADCGAAIALTIMSDITPSYYDASKAEENKTVAEIKTDMFVPYIEQLDKIEETLGARFTQIPDAENTKYEMTVKLFDFDKPLKMLYEGAQLSNSIANPEINLLKCGVTFDEIKPVLDKNLGECKTSTYDSGLRNYFYNSIYGNCYQLYYNPSSEELGIAIYGYNDYNKEAYELKDGNLKRLDDVELMIIYSVTKENGKIKVIEDIPHIDENLSVSDKAQTIWNKVKPLLTEEELQSIDYVVLESDGIGSSTLNFIRNNENNYGDFTDADIDGAYEEIPEEYRHLSKGIKDAILDTSKYIGEGETMKAYVKNVPGNKLYIDPLDFLNENGDCYTDEALLKSIEAMRAATAF